MVIPSPKFRIFRKPILTRKSVKIKHGATDLRASHPP